MGGTLRIGGGAGFAGDRIEPAVDLVERGELDYLVLECLAERTIALGQQRRLQDPTAGYDQRLDSWIRALAPALGRHPTRLVSNFGSANPAAAGERIRELCDDLGAPLDVAVLLGDDVLGRIDPAPRRTRTGARSRSTASSCRRTPTSAPTRCSARSGRAPASWSPAASRIPRCSSPRSPTPSTGTSATGISWAVAPRSATCSSAGRS